MLIKPRAVILTFATIAIVAAGCKDGSPTEQGSGTVTGVITAADNQTPIPGVRVTLESSPASGPSATTDPQGAYTLAGVPAGSQRLLARRGNFEAVFSVNVAANGITQAPATRLQNTGKLGYVEGEYDDIQRLIRGLGYTIEKIEPSQLANASVTSQYAVIFLNCGMDYDFSNWNGTLQNLRSYVQGGGILYASDLTQDLMRQLYPQDFLQSGSGSTQVFNATVEYQDLRNWLGFNTMNISYANSPGWATLESISSRPQVLLRGTSGVQNGKPLAVMLRPPGTQGALVYTTFHNFGQATSQQLAVLRYFIFLDVGS
jgi:hypothetical protein